jgi:hypothetical protein
MNKLDTYQASATKISKDLNGRIRCERMCVADDIRTAILLPFCKKHKLTMKIGIYSNHFTFPNGDIYYDYELPKVIKGEMAKNIRKYLTIDFMGDYLFDIGMDMDITKEDLAL